MKTMDELMRTFPRAGRVDWIGLRPDRKAPLDVVADAVAIADRGLEGDRSSQKHGSKRQVTLIQGEHLDAAAAMLGIAAIDPGLTRRNIVVRGINLLALKGHRIRIGDAVVEFTEECHPCSRMEENLGPGGYNAMRGHGGWCAVVLEGGAIRLGDGVSAILP
jgi:MOSC domain-containing protein YiiM